MIDGLRGIAAMLVVFFHLYGNLRGAVSPWFPRFLDTLLAHGNIGVQIFFVISGFVIAYSVGDKHINLAFIGKFALRRSIRLDPPYWVSIAIAIFLIYLSTVMFSDIHRELPTPVTVLIHLVYLQDMMGYGNIVAVYWTLCLEVQFYLLYVISFALLQRATGTDSIMLALRSTWVLWLTLALGLASVCNYFGLFTIAVKHTFLPYWHNFFLGSLICWYYKGWIKQRYFLVSWLVLLGFTLYFNYEVNAVTTLVTAMAVFIAGMRNRLADIFSSAPYQYLGKISYSLYLFHPIIGWRVISVGKRYLGPDINVVEACLLFLAGVMISIMVSDIVYRFIEKPSLSLSHRIKLKTNRTAEAEFAYK